MNQFYVPTIGEQVKLAKDWEFPLHYEGRNCNMLERCNPNVQYSWRNEGSIIVKLEAGTILQVDRIYIRKGKGEWDSITFFIKEAPGDENRLKSLTKRRSRWSAPDENAPKYPADAKLKFKGARFWAKLEDVNEIQFEKV